MIRAAFVALLVGGTLAACGSDRSSTAQRPESSAPVPPATSALSSVGGPGNTPSNEPPAPGSGGIMNFQLTSPDGWHYSAEIPFPATTVSFSKDVSASPPGLARLVWTLTGELPSGVVIPDDNPGRPGGPTYSLTAGQLFLVNPAVAGVSIDSDNLTAGPCQIEFVGNNGFDNGIDCSLTGVAGTTGYVETDETTVDDVIAASDGHQYYVFNLVFNFYTCNIYVDETTGEVTFTKGYSSNGCPEVQIDVG